MTAGGWSVDTEVAKPSRRRQPISWLGLWAELRAVWRRGRARRVLDSMGRRRS